MINVVVRTVWEERCRKESSWQIMTANNAQATGACSWTSDRWSTLQGSRLAARHRHLRSGRRLTQLVRLRLIQTTDTSLLEAT
jgi:hypothetical protein